MGAWTKAGLEERLTPRQYEVLSLIAQRFSSKEIGRQLSLSPKTVDRHVEEINARLGVSSRSEAGRHFLEALATHGEELPMGTATVAPPAGGAPQAVQPEGEPLGTPKDSPDLTHDLGSLNPAKRFFTLPPVGGKRHDLTLKQRLAMVSQIALFAIIIIAAIVTVITGILHLLGR